MLRRCALPELGGQRLLDCRWRDQRREASAPETRLQFVRVSELSATLRCHLGDKGLLSITLSVPWTEGKETLSHEDQSRLLGGCATQQSKANLDWFDVIFEKEKRNY